MQPPAPYTSYRTPEHRLACAGCGRWLRVSQVEGQQFGRGRRRDWCGACALRADAARWELLAAVRTLAATVGSGLP